MIKLSMNKISLTKLPVKNARIFFDMKLMKYFLKNFLNYFCIVTFEFTI